MEGDGYENNLNESEMTNHVVPEFDSSSFMTLFAEVETVRSEI